MEFRRITNLPPYVFTIIDGLKIEARRAGVDVDRPRLRQPRHPLAEIAVDKLAEAAHNARNHRYSVSRGIPKLREAVGRLYQRSWGVELDPETEIINTIGAKEGFSHLMWVLLAAAATPPSCRPSYPIHIYGPLFAGADLRQVPDAATRRRDFFEDFFESCVGRLGWPKPRVLVLSFPHNPTGACVDLAVHAAGRRLRREQEMIVVHDFAYADLGFDGYQPPVHPPGRGGQGVRRRAVLDDQVLLDGRLARGVPGRQRRGRAGAGQAQELPRLRHVPADPDRRHGHHERGRRLPEGGLRDLPEPPRRARATGWPASAGTSPSPRGTMFVWAPIPEPYREMGSLEFASHARARLRRGHSRPASASAPAARASSASPSSRTSSASPRPSATSARACTKLGRRRAGGARHERHTIGHAGAPIAVGYRRSAWTTYVVRVWLPDRPGAWARWPAASAPCGATSSASRSSSGAAAGPSTSWSSPCPTRPGRPAGHRDHQVDGVDVEDVPCSRSDRHDPGLTRLETAARLVEADDAPGCSSVLCDALGR